MTALIVAGSCRDRARRRAERPAGQARRRALAPGGRRTGAGARGSPGALRRRRLGRSVHERADAAGRHRRNDGLLSRHAGPRRVPGARVRVGVPPENAGRADHGRAGRGVPARADRCAVCARRAVVPLLLGADDPRPGRDHPHRHLDRGRQAHRVHLRRDHAPRGRRNLDRAAPPRARRGDRRRHGAERGVGRPGGDRGRRDHRLRHQGGPDADARLASRAPTRSRPPRSRR